MHHTHCFDSFRRRGAVVVQVAVGMTAILGFAALGIDVGLMYATRADLQKAADAAALAAASQLGNFDVAEDAGTTVVGLARQAAADLMDNNEVMGQDIVLDNADIVFGYSLWDSSTSEFAFQAANPTSPGINAVRVTTRRTSGSSNGPLDLVFGGLFGHEVANVTASATAILVPRDIMIVADLSGSYNDDSLLQNYDENDPHGINLYEVWQTLPRTSAAGVALQSWLDANPDMDVSDAPSSYFEGAYGLFKDLGSTAPGSVPIFGTTLVNSSYDPRSDSGLVRLALSEKWDTAGLGATDYGRVSQFLERGVGYDPVEWRAIMADTGTPKLDDKIIAADTNVVAFASEYNDKKRYDLRAAVALGLVYWSSGKPNAIGDRLGLPAGNGDDYVDASEIYTRENYPFPSGNWFEYVQYMRDSNNSNLAYDAINDIQYRFGAKTFTNFVFEEKERNDETDVGHFAFANPLNITKNALDVLMADLQKLDSADRVGLVTYAHFGTLDYALPPSTVTLEENTDAVAATYRQRQAAHYSSSTNIGHGLEVGAQELDHTVSGSSARPEAQKVIVLMTDGRANIDSNGGIDPSGSTATAYAISAAQAAWTDQRAKIHAIGVGSSADITTLDSIAAAGQTGDAFWANGDFDQIETELVEIFHRIGGLRPVQLIE